MAENEIPNAKVPEFKEFEGVYDYKNFIHDYGDLEKVDQATTKARKALFILTAAMNEASRKVSLFKAKRDRTWKRAYIVSDQKTDTLKKMWADLEVEDIDDELLVQEQYLSELNRESNALRLELQALQAIGNNIRQQVRGN